MLETKIDNNAEIDFMLFDKMLEYIENKTGMTFTPRLFSWIQKQLIQTAQNYNYDSIDRFMNEIMLDKSAKISQEIFETLTVHETMFYRDKKYFHFLRSLAIPKIMENNKDFKEMNIWIAAGSSGQEIYSILFTIAEHFPELMTWKLNLYSTDLSNEIIAKGKEAIYESHEMNRGMEDLVLRNKFFDAIEGQKWQIKDKFRKMINFQTSNLVENYTGLPNFDFISCRNVLIYFKDDTKKEIIQKLSQKVRENGFLVLGQVDFINNKEPPAGFKYELYEVFPYFQKAL